MTVRPFAAVLMSAFVLAACGGDGATAGGAGGEGSATASWDGGELAFDRVSCRPIPGGESFTVNARSEDNTIQARFGDTGTRGEYDYAQASVTLEILGENWTVQERYVANQQSVELDSAGEDHARGRAEMRPRNDGAHEANPEGVTLEFDISC